MGLAETLKKINRKEQFNPGLLGVFISAGYFIKRGIYRGIRRNSSSMSGTMLDFGCGNKPYRRLFTVDRYIGIDIENSAHSHEGEPVDFIYDGRKIPFENKYFDCAFASEVFEHVFNLDEALDELNRVLKEGGNLLITIPFAWYQHEKPNDYARYTEFGIRHLLEKHKFKIVVHEKTSAFFETAVQLWISYLYEGVFPKNNFLKILLSIFFIAPFNIFGIIGSKIFPKNYDFYLNHIIVAKKAGDS